MLSELINISLNNRLLIVLLFVLMAVLGFASMLTIPVDAIPDMTNVQVVVLTEANGLSPVEMEQFVTTPIEKSLGGLPRMTELRSVSKFGISSITIVFQDGTDVYRARQLVQERLVQAQGELKMGDAVPQLSVLSTALGEVLQFEVRSNPKDGQPPRSLMDLRSILEWEIAPKLRQVEGVTEINVHGGFYKSYQVTLDPDRLASQQISLTEVRDALQNNNAISGGGYIVHEGEQRLLRGESMLQGIDDIANVVVRAQPNDAPTLVKDVANVELAPLARQGAVTRDGRGEVVTGMVLMLLGENSRTVTSRAKARLKEIAATLPSDVSIEILYDRSALIGRTLETVVHNLLEGGILVVIVLLILLGSVRAGLIVALAIPISMLFATNMMAAFSITASLMSLGAIDFGLIVDSSVIMIENCMHRLAHPPAGKSRLEIIRDAAIEVRTPTMFGELIIAVVYIPILTLQGTEGKLFQPMALTVLLALAGSLILSLTLMPVLAFLALPKDMGDEDVWLINQIKRIYLPLVHTALRFNRATVALALFITLVSIPVAIRLGAEFMPRLDEGDILIEMNRLPSASLEDVVPMSTQVEDIIRKHPEVRSVFCKTGRPEIANDVMGVQQTDVWVMLKPVSAWPTKRSYEDIVNDISEELNRKVPGATFGFTQPIEMRVDELVAGVKADVAVLIYGDDLDILAEKAGEIQHKLNSIRGSADVKANYSANSPTLTIKTIPQQLARYGIPASQVLDSVTALGGQPAGQIYEGRARYPIMIRYPKSWREDRERLGQVPIQAPNGEVVPLKELAELSLEETPPSVDHEATRRRSYVQCNVRGRDVASFVQELQQVLDREIKLPPGYEIKLGGDFEHLQTASRRLMIITPFVLLMIWLLLHTSLSSARLATLIFLAVPVAASGGIFALAMRGMPFSISAGVGFIALFGVAVLNGLVWVSGAEHCRQEGKSPEESAEETAAARIRPILMTAAVASLGFLPMAISTTAGAEIQRPLATVVIGGLVTSTLLTAFVIPVLYTWVAPRDQQST